MRNLILILMFLLCLPAMASLDTCMIVLDNGDMMECELDLTKLNDGLETHLEFGDKLHQYFYREGKVYPVLYQKMKGDGHGGSSGEGIILNPAFKGDGHGGSSGEGIILNPAFKGDGHGGSSGEGIIQAP